jgi:hypothetical protein
VPLKGQLDQNHWRIRSRYYKDFRLLQLCAEPAYQKIEKSVLLACPCTLAMLYTIFLYSGTGVKQLVPIPQLMTRWRYPFLRLQLQ